MEKTRRCGAEPGLVRRRSWVVAAGVLLAGCASVRVPDVAVDARPVPAAWSVPVPAGLATTSAVSRAWWSELGDSLLDALIDRATEAAPDLRTAQLRVRESRARLALADAGLAPSVSGSVGASRSRSSQATSGVSTTRTVWSADLDASWEVDLFGRLDAASQAARADLGAAEASLGDVQVTLRAEVARNYLEYRGLQSRLAVARESLAIQTETWQITDWRARAGLVTVLDVEQALASREQTRAQVAALEGSLAASRLSLELLLGRAPGDLTAELAGAVALPAVPQRLAWLMPADVLRQRPDVRQAEAQWQAEAARSAQADANRYPKLNLSGSIGLAALSLGTLGDGFNASLAAGLAAPIFDAGRLRAQLEAQQAVQARTQVAYEKAVLAALSDVEGALAALQAAQAQVGALDLAARSAREAARLARTRYQGGLIDFRTVLDAERTALSAEDGLVSARGSALAAWVRLYKALGGGWQPAAAEPTKAS